jgi:hypothetical protein
MVSTYFTESLNIIFWNWKNHRIPIDLGTFYNTKGAPHYSNIF